MKKKIIFIAVIIALPIGYWLISPLFINKEVSESLQDIAPVVSPAPAAPETTVTPPAQEPQIIASGAFSGLAKHNAAGTARLVKSGENYFVRFEDNFKITNGPDLFVHFGKDGEYSAAARLGELKGNIGGQNYQVPAGIDVNDFNEVWVWCRAFSVPFGKAELK